MMGTTMQPALWALGFFVAGLGALGVAAELHSRSHRCWGLLLEAVAVACTLAMVQCAHAMLGKGVV